MSTLAAANQARAFYGTPQGRRIRLHQLEREAARLGAQVDALRAAGEPIPQRLRDELRLAVRRHSNVERRSTP